MQLLVSAWREIGRVGLHGNKRASSDVKGAVLLMLLAVLGAGLDPAYSQGITEFPLPATGRLPVGICAGPDGALWFTEQNGNRIGRITTAGVITEFPLPNAGSVPNRITAGPDGALWFTEFSGNRIGRITTAGMITEFPLPNAGSEPTGITAGPDGALWFTESSDQARRIGRITTAGAISEFNVPAQVSGIAAGPDGALWFIHFGAGKIGRITPAGAITEFPLPNAHNANGITAGPDGALWFTENSENRIGRITTAGAITEFELPVNPSGPASITAGPDGAIWFTEQSLKASRIGRITTAGVLTEFAVPTYSPTLQGITVGPDGALWFAEGAPSKIGRISPDIALGDRTKANLSLTAGGVANASTFASSLSVRAGYAVGTVSSGAAPYGTAVFIVTQGGVVVSEAAVPASQPTTAARLFIDYGTRVPSGPPSLQAGPVDIYTGIAAVNPGTATAGITFTLRDMQGRVLATGHGSLAPGAHRAVFLQQLKELAPDFVLPADFASATRFGSLEIAGDKPIGITALRMTVNQRADTIFTTVPVADLTQSPGSSPLFFPHVADGGGYLTTFLLLNTTNQPQSGVLRFFASDGSLFSVRPLGGTADTSFRYTIPADGGYLFQTDGSPASVLSGSLQLTPDSGTATPASAGIFNQTVNRILITESGIPSATPTTHARIYVDRKYSHTSGLAIAATTAASLPVTLKAYQSDGSTPAGSATYNLSIPGNGQTALFVGNWISGLPASFTGVLDISAPAPFAALTLRFLSNARGDLLFTTFPIADMTRPAPTPLLFPQLADGGGYRTEFILISAGGSAEATVSFLGDDGKPLAVGSGAPTPQ